MAVVLASYGSDNEFTLVRNHELGAGAPFSGAPVYNPAAAGGTYNLTFRNGEFVKSWPSLAGTNRNCAGGRTPWGTWLSGEETLDTVAGKPHGYVFEVPGAEGDAATARPLTAMGRFSHEAVALDPRDGVLYLTEDQRGRSGFYRFTPAVPGDLLFGGTLEMLKVVGQEKAYLGNLDGDGVPGGGFDIEWVKITDPDPKNGAHSLSSVLPIVPGDTSRRTASGVWKQGYDKGGATFARLEGAWFGNGGIYFVDTAGGVPSKDPVFGEGSVWKYNPNSGKLQLIFASPNEETADNPDNITVSPRGGLLLCEDGDLDNSRLRILTPGGNIFCFAENWIPGNSNNEFAGATFDPFGEWLFVNIQTPGVTFAITGPWEDVGL